MKYYAALLLFGSCTHQPPVTHYQRIALLNGGVVCCEPHQYMYHAELECFNGEHAFTIQAASNFVETKQPCGPLLESSVPGERQ